MLFQFEQRKYTDVIRMGHRDSVGVISEGAYITVYEKLDGANASFRLCIAEDGTRTIQSFSRNTPLSPENNLRGFYDWALKLGTIDLIPGYIYYGEWLVKHKVDYGKHAGNFYLFDIYDIDKGKYLSAGEVVSEGSIMGIAVAPILYAGPFVSYEHLESLVGRSAFSIKPGEGEGIVVKNIDFRDVYGRQVFVKIVSEKFREMQPQKAPSDPNKPVNVESVFVNTFMTTARVEKLLFKLVDEGIITEDFGIEDMGRILSELGPRIYEDLLKEESSSLPSEYNEKEVMRSIGKTLPLAVKIIMSVRAS